MRETLTILGFLLIVAFGAAFSAPLYMDWNQWRETIAEHLSQQVGAKVTISGRIDVRILPQPWLSLEGVTVGDSNAGTRLNVERLDGDLNLTSLLTGKAALSHAVLSKPTLMMSIGKSGEISPLSLRQIQDTKSSTFDVKDGTLHYIDKATGQRFFLNAIELSGETRPSLGSIRGEGSVSITGITYKVKMASEETAPGTLSLKLSVASAQPSLSLELDGSVTMREGHPVFLGKATAFHDAPPSPRGAFSSDQPWRLTGLITLTPEKASAEKFDVQLGPDNKALKFMGKASIKLGSDTSIDMQLSGRQLDIDRFIGIKTDQKIAPAIVFDQLRKALPISSWAPTRFNIAIGNIIMGDQILGDIHADLLFNQKGWQLSELSATLPGQTRLTLTGKEVADGNLAGRVMIETRQASALTAWIQGEEQETGANSARQLSLDAIITAEAGAVILSDLLLSIDNAKVSGRLGWSWKAGSRGSRIDADLVTQQLDLDALPVLTTIFPGGEFSEVDIRLKAQKMIWEGVEAKSISGHIKADKTMIEIDDVRIDDLGGTSLSASGRVEGLGSEARGEMRVRIDGRDLTLLAKAFRHSSLPADIKEAFAIRAVSLSPANATIVLSLGDKKSLTLDGKLGGSVASIAAELVGPIDRGQIEAHLKLDSLDAGALLRQLGIRSPMQAVPGRAGFSASLSGSLTTARRWSLAFQGGGLGLESTGRMTGGMDSPAIDGRMSLEIDDLKQVGQMIGIPFTGAAPGDNIQIQSGVRVQGGHLIFNDLTGIFLGSPINGTLSILPGTPARMDGSLAFEKLDGARLGSLLAGVNLKREGEEKALWNGDVFGPSSTGGLTGTLSLSAKSAIISSDMPSINNLKANLTLEPGTTTIGNLQGKMAEGQLIGSLKVSHTAPDMSLTGKLSIVGASLSTTSLNGRFNASIEFQGNGRSPSSMVASLTGNGALGIESPHFERLSGNAFGEVLEAVEANSSERYTADIALLFEQGLSQDKLSTSDLNGSLQLSGGTLRLLNTKAKAREASVSISGFLNLSNLESKADLALSFPAPSDGLGGPPPAILLTLSGSTDSLSRRIDVAALKAWLVVRAADRESRKLETLENKYPAQELRGTNGGSAEPNTPERGLPDLVSPPSPPTRQPADAPAPTTGAVDADDVPPLPPPYEINPPPRIAPRPLAP